MRTDTIDQPGRVFGGSDYVGTIVEPQFRSAIREVTASYEVKALYSAEREKIATEIFTLFRRLADFQRIVAQGISVQLLEWQGIEATEKLAASCNTKIVIIGNSKTGLPIILGEKVWR